MDAIPRILTPWFRSDNDMKPSAAAILNYMLRHGGWLRTVDIIRECPTVTPSKRLSELRSLGLIETRGLGNRKEYRAKESAA